METKNTDLSWSSEYGSTEYRKGILSVLDDKGDMLPCSELDDWWETLVDNFMSISA